MEREPFEKKGHYYVTVSAVKDGKPVTLMRSLRTTDRQKALRTQGIANDIMTDVELGKRQLPEKVALGDDTFWKWLIEWGGEEKKVEQAKNNRMLEDLLSEFLKDREVGSLAPDTKVLDRIYARHLRRYMAEKGKELMRAVDADEEFFRGYKTWRLEDEVLPQTYNKERAWQSTLCGAFKKLFTKGNPLEDVKPEKKKISEQRFRTAAQIKAELAERKYADDVVENMWDARILTKQEIGHFLKLAKEKDPDLYPMLVVAACTGARRGEIARLKWADVDFKSRVIWFMSRKGSREDQSTSRDVSATDLLVDALNAQKLKTGNASYVFPSPKGEEFNVNDMTERINVLTEGTEFASGCGWHCFRHSVASILAAEGKDRREINAVLGHVTEQMERRYRHLMPKQRKAAVAALEYKIV